MLIQKLFKYISGAELKKKKNNNTREQAKKILKDTPHEES